MIPSSTGEISLLDSNIRVNILCCLCAHLEHASLFIVWAPIVRKWVLILSSQVAIVALHDHAHRKFLAISKKRSIIIFAAKIVYHHECNRSRSIPHPILTPAILAHHSPRIYLGHFHVSPTRTPTVDLLLWHRFVYLNSSFFTVSHGLRL